MRTPAPLAYSLTHSRTHARTHSRTHALARSLTRSLAHSLPHSPTHPLINKQAKLLSLLQREITLPEWREGTAVVFCGGAARARALHAAVMAALPASEPAPLLLHEELPSEERTAALQVS